jgi:hypothetical protein
MLQFVKFKDGKQEKVEKTNKEKIKVDEDALERYNKTKDRTTYGETT